MLDSDNKSHSLLATVIDELREINHTLKEIKMAEDFSKLTASIAKLKADFEAFLATQGAGNQAAIDAAQASVDAIDAEIPAPATPPAA
jgi:hypothetical protein